MTRGIRLALMLTLNSQSRQQINNKVRKVPYIISVALCGYLEKGSFQTAGCVTLSVDDTTLKC